MSTSVLVTKVRSLFGLFSYETHEMKPQQFELRIWSRWRSKGNIQGDSIGSSDQGEGQGVW